MMRVDYLSPLRYPGAKRQIAPHIAQLLREYRCIECIFVEPCCGGASVSLYLLEKRLVSSVILMDFDPWVASFWKMLFSNTDQLISDIEEVEVSVKTWMDFKENEPQSVREKALYCFFFNRTCYSGILNAGMIGGNSQSSEYKIDCRFNKQGLIERIKRIADQYSDRVLDVQEASVFHVLEQGKLDNNKDCIYYIDPPYVTKGRSLYPHNFRFEEHKRLRTSLEGLHKPWILSYHDHWLVRNLYLKAHPFESTALDVIWVADRAKRGKELLITNLPNVRTKVVIDDTQPELWTAPASEIKALTELAGISNLSPQGGIQAL